MPALAGVLSAPVAKYDFSASCRSPVISAIRDFAKTFRGRVLQKSRKGQRHKEPRGTPLHATDEHARTGEANNCTTRVLEHHSLRHELRTRHLQSWCT